MSPPLPRRCAGWPPTLPRAAVAAVHDLQDDSGVQLILTGAEFDNVKVPIYGTNG
jgi:hypothetical protein